MSLATAAAVDTSLHAWRRAYRATDGGGGFCSQLTYAHRALHHLLVTEFECTSPLTHNKSNTTLSVLIKQAKCGDSWIYESLCPKINATAHYSRAEVPVSGNLVCTRSTMAFSETASTPVPVLGECHTKVPESGMRFEVPAGATKTITLVSARFSNVDGGVDTVMSPSLMSDDPVTAAEAACRNATALAVTGKLLAGHAAAMSRLNRPGIEVDGNIEFSRVVNASVAALLGAYRADSPYSSSPEGLASTRYEGDAFWDVETWQWPTWLLFWPDMARAALAYRVRLAEQARANARLPLPGYPPAEPRVVGAGLKFPWQSGVAGIEQCPGNMEDHLQGDISMAFQQFWLATQDLDWLKSDGWPVINGIAEFYAGRATCDNPVDENDNDSGAVVCHINQTCGPDEYHCGVNDSAYGNAVARRALLAAHELAATAGEPANSTFKSIADALHIPYDAELDYHPEFTGFNRSNSLIKQADVVLMSYPLAMQMPSSTRARDLEIYANATDPHGVAMTWGIHAIVHRDVGNEAKADECATKFRLYSRPPFYTWHEGEAPDGSDGQGAPNLVTAAGGFLQQIWAGYGGVRFEPGGEGMLIRQPRPLPNSTRLRLRQVHYLGARLDIEATLDGWSFGLSPSSPRAASALVYVPYVPGNGGATRGSSRATPLPVTRASIRMARGTSIQILSAKSTRMPLRAER